MKKNKLIKYILILLSIFFIIKIIFNIKKFDKKCLYIMSWNNTVDSNLIQKFEKLYNAKVYIKYYTSNEELISKTEIYNKNIDIIFPSDYIINDLLKKNLIKSININKINYIKQIIPELLNKSLHNKKYYGIPINWGIFGIAVNKNLHKSIDSNIDIYKSFFTGKYNKECFSIAVINDMPTVVNIAYQYYRNYFKKNKIYNKKNLFTILYEILIQQKKNVVLYTHDSYLQTIFENNIIDMALIESSRYLKIINDNPKLNLCFLFSNYYVLKVCEYMAISSHSQNEELAYKFINFMLDDEQVSYSSNIDFSFSSRKDMIIKMNKNAQDILQKIEKNKKNILFTDEILNKKELIALWMKIKN